MKTKSALNELRSNNDDLNKRRLEDERKRRNLAKCLSRGQNGKLRDGLHSLITNYIDEKSKQELNELQEKIRRE